MSPQDVVIVVCAVLDLLALVAIGVVGLRFRALATQGQKSIGPLIERGQRIAGTTQRMVGTARTRGETMLHIVQTLAAHVSAKVATTRRIVTEIVHPDTSALDTVTRTLEQGRAWSDRLGRLRAAAQRASGGNGHDRRRV